MHPDCQSALKPVFHNLGIPVPIPPAKSDIENEKTYESSVSIAESSADEMYVADVDVKKPHVLSQLEFNDFVRDLALSKEKVVTEVKTTAMESTSRGYQRFIIS